MTILTIKKVTKSGNTGVEIRQVTIGDIVPLAGFCDFIPSWQNSIESLERGKAGLTFLGAFSSGVPVGYCVFDKATGDISQIAVSPDYRRQGIASAMLGVALPLVSAPRVKVLNVPDVCTSLPAFLDAAGVAPGLSQYEMSLTGLEARG